MPLQHLGQLKPTMQQQIALQRALLTLGREDERLRREAIPESAKAGVEIMPRIGPDYAATHQPYDPTYGRDMEYSPVTGPSLPQAIASARVPEGVGIEGDLSTKADALYEFVGTLGNEDRQFVLDKVISIGEGGTVSAEGEVVEVAGAKDPLMQVLIDKNYIRPEGDSWKWMLPPDEVQPPDIMEQARTLVGDVDDAIGNNPQLMMAMIKGENWESIETLITGLGVAGEYEQEVVNNVLTIWKALHDEAGKMGREPEAEGGGLVGAIRGALTPLGVGREELPTEAIPGSEAYLEGAGAFKEGAPLAEKAPGFAKTLEDFIETIITGPFSPAYKEYRGKRRGVAEPKVEEEEVGPTVEDAITDMKTWDESRVKEFQEIAKNEGIYKGNVDGIVGPGTINAMKTYFEKHKEEWK